MATFQFRLLCVLLVLFIVLSSPTVLAYCADPVSLDELMEQIDLGLTADPNVSPGDMQRIYTNLGVRGFIDVEQGAVTNEQCENDHIFVYLWIGTPSAYADASIRERLDAATEFRAHFGNFQFSINGQQVSDDELIETPIKDGFNAQTGRRMAHTLVGIIVEPYELSPGRHEVRADLTFEYPVGSGDYSASGYPAKLVIVAAPAGNK